MPDVPRANTNKPVIMVAGADRRPDARPYLDRLDIYISAFSLLIELGGLPRLGLA